MFMKYVTMHTYVSTDYTAAFPRTKLEPLELKPLLKDVSHGPIFNIWSKWTHVVMYFLRLGALARTAKLRTFSSTPES